MAEAARVERGRTPEPAASRAGLDLSTFWMAFTASSTFRPSGVIRVTGDIVALSPPLIVEDVQIDEMMGRLADVLESVE